MKEKSQNKKKGRKRKWIKRIVAATLTLLIGVGALLFCILLLVDTRWFVDRLESQITQRLDRPVRVQSVSVGYFPSLGIDLHGVEIDNPEEFDREQMLTIGTIRVTAPVIPNISNPVQMHIFRIEDAEVHIHTNKQGRSNWDFSPQDGPEGTQEEEKPDEAGFDLPALPAIRRIGVRDALVHVESPGESTTYTIASAALEHVNYSGNFKADIDMAIDGKPFRIEGSMASLENFLEGESEKLSITASHRGNTLNAKGIAGLGGAADVELALSGESFPELSDIVSVELPEWKNYTLKGHLKRTVDTENTTTLTLHSLKLPGTTFTGRATLKEQNEAALALDAELQEPASQLQATATFSADGSYAVDLSSSGEQMAVYAPLFNIDLPALESYELEGRFSQGASDDAPVEVSDAVVRVKDSHLAGDARIELEPLFIHARLRSESLDLTQLGPYTGDSDPEAEEAAASAKEAREGGDDSDSVRIPYESMASLNADVELQAASVRATDRIVLKELQLNGSLDSGKLTVPRLSARTMGGSFDSSFSAGDETLRLKFDGRNFDSNPVGKLVGGKLLFDGLFDVSADLTAAGDTVPGLKKTLDGTLTFTAVDATLKSQTVQIVSSNLFSILSPIFGNSNESHVECALFEFDIKEGVAQSETQVIKIDQVFFFGNGKVNIPTGELDYRYNASSRIPSLASLVPPFRVFGDLGNPMFVPTVSGSVASVVDTTEGLARTALGFLGRSAQVLLGQETEGLEGLAVCKKAHEIEENLLTSRVGNVLP